MSVRDGRPEKLPLEVEPVESTEIQADNALPRGSNACSDRDAEAKAVPSINADDEILGTLGYKAELKREFSALRLFGMGFTIMSVAPSIASVLVDQLPGGGVGLSWGWIVPCFFILSLGVTMSELASSMPTSGGFYWWTYKLAPQRWKSYLSFLCGYADSLGLTAGAGSINYGAAQQILSCATISTGYNPSSGVIFAVFLGITVLQCGIGCFPGRVLSHLQTVAIVLNFVCIGIICIALPIGTKHKGLPMNSGEFVFGDTTNYTNYPYGISFLLTWLSPAWTISSQDVSVNMAEQATNATTAIPFGILSSVISSAVLGWVIVCVIAACIDASPAGMQKLMNSNMPLSEIIERGLNRKWATGIMAIFSVVQFMMGLSQLTSASRQCYAFARDDALPFSRWVKRTTKNQLPIPGVIFAATVSLCLGLLILAGSIAANAIFSLGLSSVYLAWCIPIFIYASDWKPLAQPGPFYLGHTLSKINAIIASAYGIWVIGGLTMIPTDIPVKTASEMNYTCVVCCAVWGLSSIYWLVDARKWYTGPNVTLDDEEMAEILEAHEWEVAGDPSAKKGKRKADKS